MKNKTFILFIIISLLLPLAGISAYNASGYAWSENIGWINFRDDAAAHPYGVKVDGTTGDFSGYAWSENIGWISFNSSEFGDCPGSSSGWYDSSWTKRKKITIQNDNVDSDLTDFPLYVNIVSDSDIGGTAQSDGDDILFTAGDGTTKLSHEEEYFNISSGNATGHYWVKVPVVNSASTTDIYIYYGNTSASDQQQVSEVWNSYNIVYHLSSLNDSTGNTGGASLGGDAALSSGIVGNGYTFDESGDYISIPDDSDLALPNGNWTVSIWVKLDDNTGSDSQFFFSQNEGESNNWQHWYFEEASSAYPNKLAVSLGDTNGTYIGIYSNSNPGTSNSWQYLVMQRVGNTVSQYIDTSFEGNKSKNPYYSIDGITDLYLGSCNDERPEWFFGGDLDELRITSSALGSDWLKFEYHNMKDADELSWGEEEAVVAGDCQANMDLVTGEVSGWARACRVFKDGCSGDLKDDIEIGGWYGWINLSGANYGVYADDSSNPSEFKDYAWGGEVIGWVSFNCSNNGSCASSDYKVILDGWLVNEAPVAVISGCSPSSCQVYFKEDLNLINDSHDPNGNEDIVLSRWFTKPMGAPDSDYWLQWFSEGLGDYPVSTLSFEVSNWYTAKLEVTDAGGLSDETIGAENKDFYILRDILADFECSLNGDDYGECNFDEQGIVKALEGETIYFRDSDELGTRFSKGSEKSPGKYANINYRRWYVNSEEKGSGATFSLEVPKELTEILRVGLLVRDNSVPYREAWTEKNILGLIPLPSWHETSPF